MKANFARIVLVGVMGLVLGGCAHQFDLGVQKKTVNLQVVGNPPTLKIISPPDPKCKAHSENGCVYVAKNDVANIEFNLNAPPDWSFSKFILCVGATKDSQVCSLTPWQRLEFAAVEGSNPNGAILVPNANGEIDLTGLSAASAQSFRLLDLNVVAGEYFYSIEVCNASATPPCLTTDPPIDNTGKGIGTATLTFE